MSVGPKRGQRITNTHILKGGKYEKSKMSTEMARMLLGDVTERWLGITVRSSLRGDTKRKRASL